MSEVTAHDAFALKHCRIPGCDQDASPLSAATGRYANLCKPHHDAERQKSRDQQTGKSRSAGHSPLGGFEQRAKGLVAAGRKLDRVILAHKDSRAALDDALAEWEEAKRDLSVKPQAAE